VKDLKDFLDKVFESTTPHRCCAINFATDTQLKLKFGVSGGPFGGQCCKKERKKNPEMVSL
jgi:hypothetical protein